MSGSRRATALVCLTTIALAAGVGAQRLAEPAPSKVALRPPVAREPVTARLPAPTVLRAGRSVSSGQYVLALGADGALTVRGNGRVLWSATTRRAPGGTLTVRPDGVARLLDRTGRTVWATRSAGGRARLELRPDGDLVLVRRDGSPVWHTGRPGADTLSTGARLQPGQYVAARSGSSRLTMRADGTLVQTGPYGGQVWAVACRPGSAARLGADGVLTVASGSSVCWRGPRAAGSRITVTARDTVVQRTGSVNRPVTPSDALTAYRTTHADRVLFERINADRAALGLKTLRRDAGLTALAADHAAAMARAGTVAHVVAGERSLPERLAGYRSGAENVGSHQDTTYQGVLRLHRVMMQAGGDASRAALLNPTATRVGVAVRVQDGSSWLVEEFAANP